MMSNQEPHMWGGDLREAVEPVLRVLSQLGGHFTFTGQQGEQFVITRKTDFDALKKQGATSERQLPMAAARRREIENLDDVLGRINREIALFQSLQEEEAESVFDDEIDDVTVEEMDEAHQAPMRPPVRVRFEPIRGDLPPELQE
ncbi:MAG: hypothetical protein HY006_00170 [Candidatus Sungbacteria bacterium]|nr:hypothetical protein [Candidatus Sungbacteria bacterium]